LLAENDLPFSDVSARLLDGFVVIEDASRALVGNVGLERFGCNALLRSLAMALVQIGTICTRTADSDLWGRFPIRPRSPSA
jgi:hypothetical protein